MDGDSSDADAISADVDADTKWVILGADADVHAEDDAYIDKLMLKV